jgi:tRNA pseudouridine38-40 synthase
MNYLVTVSYDGSNFHGWAKQLNVRTVQEEIENIIKKIFNQNITIQCSGRTDAYVHAIGQTFSFNIKKSKITPKTLLTALRSSGPSDIYFIKVKQVDSMFNARFSAKNKTYQYVINTSEFDLFRANYELYYSKKINLPL